MTRLPVGNHENLAKFGASAFRLAARVQADLDPVAVGGCCVPVEPPLSECAVDPVGSLLLKLRMRDMSTLWMPPSSARAAFRSGAAPP